MLHRKDQESDAAQKAGTISLPGHFKIPLVSHHKDPGGCLISFCLFVVLTTQHSGILCLADSPLPVGPKSHISIHHTDHALWSTDSHSQPFRICANRYRGFYLDESKTEDFKHREESR